MSYTILYPVNIQNTIYSIPAANCLMADPSCRYPPSSLVGFAHRSACPPPCPPLPKPFKDPQIFLLRPERKASSFCLDILFFSLLSSISSGLFLYSFVLPNFIFIFIFPLPLFRIGPSLVGFSPSAPVVSSSFFSIYSLLKSFPALFCIFCS